MFKRFIKLILVYILFIPAIFSDIKKNSDNFEHDKVTKEIDIIKNSLTQESNIKSEKVNEYINILDSYQLQAENCIDGREQKIKIINNQIKHYFGQDNINQEQVKDAKVDEIYLNNQKKKLDKELSSCRLLKIKTDEVLNLAHKISLSKQQEDAFTWDKDFFTLILSSPNYIEKLKTPELKKINFHFILFQTLYLLASIIMGLLIFWQVTIFQKKKTTFAKSIFTVTYIAILFFLIINSLTKINIFELTEIQAIFDAITNYIVLALLGNFILIKIFSFIKKNINGTLKESELTLFKKIFLISFNLLVFKIILTKTLNLFSAEEILVQLFTSLYMLISMFIAFIFLINLYKLKLDFFVYFRYLKIFLNLLIFAYLSLIILNLIGYSNLSNYGTDILIASVIMFLIGVFLIIGINKIYHLLNNEPSLKKSLKHYLGYNSDPPFYELYVLKFLIQLAIIVILIYGFFYFINQITLFDYYFFDYIKNGFPVYGYLFTPMQFYIAILVFSCLSLFSKYIAKRISLSEEFDDETDKQVALASIILYIGFTISIVVTLIIAGFNFTSLAIIAGALSVGIGLGLQSIVNNFFSGIILLIEKPIKVGDRIIINGLEGYVKKIRIRSTQIQTPTLEDIIIPNSDLITHEVTNYMFKNKIWRVKITLGVAYNSDVEKVKEILFETAIKHPEVLNNNKNKPLIYFSSFGDSTLIFEAYCPIKNVNNKYQVLSDLNTAINEAFKENNIVIAYPQQDVNLKIIKETKETKDK